MVSPDTSVALFADDAKYSRTINGPADHQGLQQDLSSLYVWTGLWGLSFNHKKCGTMRISRKRISQAPSLAASPYVEVDLSAMHRWALAWELNFNPSKCSLLRFSHKRTVSDYCYHLNLVPIKCAVSQNDLGIFVSNDLKWSLHVTNCISRANRMLGFLRRNYSSMTNIRCRRLLYLSLVRSHLLYGSELWAPQSSSRDLVR